MFFNWLQQRGANGAAPSSSSGPNNNLRMYLILGIFGLLVLLVFFGLVKLTIIDAGTLSGMADDQHNKVSTDIAKRGTIYDRNGEVIASSIESVTINVNPNDIDYAKSVSDEEKASLEPAAEAVATKLYEVLGATYDTSYDDYYEMVTRENTAYVIIVRRCDKDLAAELKEELAAANLEGVYYEDDTTRVYPNGSIGSQVIGTVGLKMVDSDGNIVSDDEVAGRTDLSESYRGTSGLELQYDSLLAGTNGSVSQEKGSDGTPIAGGAIVVNKATDGEDIVTSIDIKLQQKAEKSLKAAVKKYSAKGGSVTVMDASSGEIYACASFVKNKSKKGKVTYDYDLGKLWSIADSYEPGSTYKVFTAYSVLANSSVTTSTTFQVPAKLKVYDHSVTDSHERNGTETMSLTKIIADSSNIGTVMASRKVSLSKLYKTYKAFGFGQDTGVDFPGAASGQLEKSADWDGVQAANITFGQGVAVTGMQLIRAYGALEQGGVMHVPHFLVGTPNNTQKSKELTSKFSKSKRVAKKKYCDQVTKMMRSVVTSGTGTQASIKGIEVVGKTGTAEIPSSTGSYLKNTWIVSFAGWLENSDCDLVCLVTLEQPETQVGGGGVAGPVFADIMSFAANRYQVSSN